MTRRPPFRVLLALAAVVVLIVAGCMSTTDVLSGKTWRLAQVHGASPVAAATLAFAPDGSFTIATGCNTVGGRFHLDSNRIVVDATQQTLVACQGAVEDQESAILAVIRSNPVFTIDTGTGRLRLTGDAGQVLLFDHP